MTHSLGSVSAPSGVLVLAMRGGMTCGALSDVPADVDPREARAAAARMVTQLVRQFHETDVDVVWEPPHDDRSWTARVRVLGDAEKESRL